MIFKKQGAAADESQSSNDAASNDGATQHGATPRHSGDESARSSQAAPSGKRSRSTAAAPASSDLPDSPAPAYPDFQRLAQYGVILLIFAAVGWVLLQVLDQTRSLMIPVAVGVLIAALLDPLALRLRRLVPRYLASGLTIVAFLSTIALMSWLSGNELVDGVSDLVDSLPSMLETLQQQAKDLGIGAGSDQIDAAIKSSQDWLKANGQEVAQRVLAVSGSALSMLVAAVMALVTAFFMMADGRNMWLWAVGLLPVAQRERADDAGRSGWLSIQSYIRAQTAVAAVDAVGIGLGAALLGLPYVIPITVIVFLTAFIPVVGAFLSGAIAVLVALAFGGVKTAGIMVLIVIAVQQLESNVLQPLLMGRAVKLHPFAVITVVALGSYLLGIVGAIFAVPVLAFAKTVLSHLYGAQRIDTRDESLQQS